MDDDIQPENVLGRTVRPAVAVKEYAAEIFRTPEGVVNAQWSGRDAWEPSANFMHALHAALTTLSDDGPDVLNLQWSRNPK